MLEKVVQSNYDTYNDLDKLLDKAKEYLDSNLIQKKFNFNTLGDKLNYLFKTKGNYKDLVRVSLIKAGLKDLKNEIKQMSRMEIFKNKPDEIVNLVEKILDANNLSICCTWKNIKSEYKNNKFKISAPTWNDAFDSPD